MRGKNGDRIRLQHILDAISEIESYLNKAEYLDFMANSMMRFACIMQLEIIGEASKHISEDTKSRFTDIDWPQISAMRNIFVHEYFGVDIKLVWEIMKSDLPGFKAKVSKALNKIEDS